MRQISWHDAFWCVWGTMKDFYFNGTHDTPIRDYRYSCPIGAVNEDAHCISLWMPLGNATVTLRAVSVSQLDEWTFQLLTQQQGQDPVVREAWQIEGNDVHKKTCAICLGEHNTSSCPCDVSLSVVPENELAPLMLKALAELCAPTRA